MDSLVEKFRNALVARQLDGFREIAVEVMCLGQPSPLFAAIAALHPDECDLAAVLDAAPEELTLLAMSSVLPSLGQAQGFRLADAYQLLRLACPRRFKSEPLCRSNIEPGLVADQWMVSCG